MRKPPIRIRGKITDGIRAAGNFTRIPWVKEQFACKLGLEIYPGTLNLEISEPEDLRVFGHLKAERGIEITPHQDSFCTARCYPVLVAGRIKGAIVFPCVEDYPKNRMEIIAPVHLREALSLKAGDVLEVELL